MKTEAKTAKRNPGRLQRLVRRQSPKQKSAALWAKVLRLGTEWTDVCDRKRTLKFQIIQAVQDAENHRREFGV